MASLVRFLVPSLGPTEVDATHLKNYKYKGEDNSLLNSYVLGGVYDSIVWVLPKWLAPNVVTILGPLPSLVCYMLIRLAYFKGEQPASWLNILAALGIFWFMLMDNCDGKHARNIKCCSPVGDWLDHSLDIVTYLVVLSDLCIMANLSTGWMLWLILVSTSFTYELVMWECYFSGILILNKFDASTEGVFCVALAHISFVIFPGWLDHPVPYTSTPLVIRDVMIPIVFIVTLTALASIKRVAASLRSSGQLFVGMLHLVIFIMPAMCGACFKMLHPEVAESHFFCFAMHTLLTGVYWIYTTIIHRLLGWPLKDSNSVLNQAVPLLIWSFLPLVLGAVLPSHMLGHAMAGICAVTVVFGFIWWWSVGLGMCKALGLPLFTVPPKKE